MIGILRNVKNMISRNQTKSEDPMTNHTKPKDNAFEWALEIILQHEGGYVDHPDDPGGATNMGITKSVYENHIGRSVTKDDMKELTFDDVKPIYKEKYWDRMHCGDMPLGVALCVFDFGVNAGTGRGAKFLQEIVGSTPDGAVGPITIKTMNEWISKNSEKGIIKTYHTRRENYYRSLKHFDTFGNGWLRRNNETTEHALSVSS